MRLSEPSSPRERTGSAGVHDERIVARDFDAWLERRSS
jgi:hypothetical protein